MGTLERALNATNTPTPPSRESTSEEDTWPDDNGYFGDSDDSEIPQYQVDGQDGGVPPQPYTDEDDLQSALRYGRACSPTYARG